MQRNLSEHVQGHGNRFTEDELLDAATIAFAGQGYGATTMETVAQRVGATKQTMYQRFGSKRELFSRCMEREAGRLEEWLFDSYDRAASLGSHSAEIRADVMAFFDFAATRPDSFRIVFDNSLGGPESTTRAELVEKIVARITVRLESHHDATTEPDTKDALYILSGLLVGMAVDCGQLMLRTELDPTYVGKLVARFALSGMKGLGIDI